MDERTEFLVQKLEALETLVTGGLAQRHGKTVAAAREKIVELTQQVDHLTELLEVLQDGEKEDDLEYENLRFTVTETVDSDEIAGAQFEDDEE